MPMFRWNGIRSVEKRELIAFEPLVAVDEVVMASRPRLKPVFGAGPNSQHARS